MLKELDTYDWREAFAFCGETSPPGMKWPEPYNAPQNPTHVQFHSGPRVSIEPVSREDVVEIIAMEDGENDQMDWVGVFKLKDGRYLALEAGCDYTGWD